MIVSTKYNFIFIHNYKVAGSSITSVLKKFGAINPPANILAIRLIESSNLLNKLARQGLTIRSIRRSFDLANINVLDAHDSAKKIKQKLNKKIWNNSFKFGFVRNPWDRQVSLYHYMLQTPSHHQHKIIKSMHSFEEYIEWHVTNAKRIQKDFFYDDYGNKLVDFIGKIENINEDFNYICKALKIREELPHINTSKKYLPNYKEYYNSKTKELIRQHFKEDIDLFNYSF